MASDDCGHDWEAAIARLEKRTKDGRIEQLVKEVKCCCGSETCTQLVHTKILFKRLEEEWKDMAGNLGHTALVYYTAKLSKAEDQRRELEGEKEDFQQESVARQLRINDLVTENQALLDNYKDTHEDLEESKQRVQELQEDLTRTQEELSRVLSRAQEADDLAEALARVEEERTQLQNRHAKTLEEKAKVIQAWKVSEERLSDLETQLTALTEAQAAERAKYEGQLKILKQKHESEQIKHEAQLRIVTAQYTREKTGYKDTILHLKTEAENAKKQDFTVAMSLPADRTVLIERDALRQKVQRLQTLLEESQAEIKELRRAQPASPVIPDVEPESVEDIYSAPPSDTRPPLPNSAHPDRWSRATIETFSSRAPSIFSPTTTSSTDDSSRPSSVDSQITFQRIPIKPLPLSNELSPPRRAHTAPQRLLRRSNSCDSLFSVHHLFVDTSELDTPDITERLLTKPRIEAQVDSGKVKVQPKSIMEGMAYTRLLGAISVTPVIGRAAGQGGAMAATKRVTEGKSWLQWKWGTRGEPVRREKRGTGRPAIGLVDEEGLREALGEGLAEAVEG